jgi:hypothetical protein
MVIAVSKYHGAAPETNQELAQHTGHSQVTLFTPGVGADFSLCPGTGAAT